MNYADYPQLSHDRIAYIFIFPGFVVLNNKIVLIKGGSRTPAPHPCVFHSLLLLQKHRVCVEGHQNISQIPRILYRPATAPQF